MSFNVFIKTSPHCMDALAELINYVSNIVVHTLCLVCAANVCMVHCVTKTHT
jgi:hypothetical protein